MTTTRRVFIQRAVAATAAAAPALPPTLGQADPAVTRIIPSTGEAIPGRPRDLDHLQCRRRSRAPGRMHRVITAFFEAGGRMINSSPMYGSSQPVIGYGLEGLGYPQALFSAEKVWTSSAADGGLKSSGLVASGACQSSTSSRCTISSPGRHI